MVGSNSAAQAEHGFTVEPASPEEVRAMTEKLEAVEGAMKTLGEQLLAIRFGLLLAGYPVNLDECLKHPMIRAEMDRERRHREAELEAEVMQAKLRELEYRRGLNAHTLGNIATEGGAVLDLSALQALRKKGTY